MIKKIANNTTNQEQLNLEPIEKVKEKLDYYRSIIPNIGKLTPKDLDELKNDVSEFFNLKPVIRTTTLPPYLFRISINNKILPEDKLNFLTEINQLLAPPIDKCNYNRCNLPNQQILYCATDEITAYWETKPKKGDVITLSVFKQKAGTSLNCSVIQREFSPKEALDQPLLEVFNTIHKFFIEVYTLPVERNIPQGYLFSAILSSDQLFYPIASDKNIDAIKFPSVQRKTAGENFAIRNELIFKYYDLDHVSTRFITEELNIDDPAKNIRPVDDLIASIKVKKFDFANSKILIDKEIIDRFEFFRMLQQNGHNQVRFDKPVPVNDLSNVVKYQKVAQMNSKKKSYNRNDRVTVMYYNNGPVKKAVKYKTVEQDIIDNKCMVIKDEL